MAFEGHYNERTLGVLGGGQLGRMLTEAANRLNIKILTLDSDNAPAKQINDRTDHVTGSFKDPTAIRELARRCDVLTVEIEHVDTDVLEEISEGMETREDWRLIRSARVDVQPSWRTIRVIQDKYKQKEHFRRLGIETAESMELEDNTSQCLEAIAAKIGYPLMLKSRTEAYDGRGNVPVLSRQDVDAALSALHDRPLYAEKWADFVAELAVMVVKTENAADADWENATLAYPVVETVHENSICKLVYAPARKISTSVMKDAQQLARRAVASFWGKGVFGVELFLFESGEILVNEIAPRPHNSGHYTMEACPLSQYDIQIRAILDLPIPQEGTKLVTPDTHAIMLNILGGNQPDSHLLAAQRALSIPGARIHLYGKAHALPGRKMGHVTVLAKSMEEAEQRIEPLIKFVDQIKADRKQPKVTSDTNEANVSKRPKEAAETPGLAGKALVAVTMGSDSDRHVLKPGIELLRELGVPYVVTITSAHRTPDRMFQFAREASSKGIKVIIAAAGGAAHLPGMIAALTSLPVIGVPVRGSILDGQDSLLSIVQMPKGCPVATVAINNSNNAAQLAVRILAASNPSIQMRLEKYLQHQTQTVLDKATIMEKTGIEEYMWEE